MIGKQTVFVGLFDNKSRAWVKTGSVLTKL